MWLVDESDGPPEGTNATAEPLLDDDELDNVVSEFHVASQEVNAVIGEEEAVRTSVTWKEARKNSSSARLDSPHAASSCGLNLEQLKKRTRCFRCKRAGHFSRECPDKFRNKLVSRSSK